MNGNLCRVADFKDEKMTEQQDEKKDGKKDVQARGWMLTIPAENHDTEQVRQMLASIAPASVFQLEEGAITGYKHYQAYVQLQSPRRWSTMKNLLAEKGFDDTHFEKQWATGAACYRYCTKEESRIDGPWVLGRIQMNDRQGERTDIAKLKKMVLEDGLSYEDILMSDDTGNAARYRTMLKDLEEARLEKRLEQQAWRDVEVNYLHGPTGVGKTRLVFERYKPSEFYRIVNYRNPWDRYKGQKVVVFDEFTGQSAIEEMLVWLDGYIVQLPARYSDKLSAYNTVWVLSNLPFNELYQYKPAEQRAAFRRRFTHIYRMEQRGTLTEETGVGIPDPWREELTSTLDLL